MRKCINCKWEGDDNLVTRDHKCCPVCGDNTEVVSVDVVIITKKDVGKLDINKDGEVNVGDAKAFVRKVKENITKKKWGRKR